MKTLFSILVALFVLLTGNTLAQYYSAYHITYGNGGVGSNIIGTVDENLLVVGTGAFTVKIDKKDGKKLFSNFYLDNDRLIVINSVKQTSNGGYIMVGRSTCSFCSKPSLTVLIKIDANGNLEWFWNIGKGNSQGNSVEVVENGYVITGETWDFGTTYTTVFLMKFDFSGNFVWGKIFDGGSYTSTAGHSVTKTSDKGFAICGSGMIKTDSLGNLEFAKAWFGGKGEPLNSIIETFDGCFILIGETKSSNILPNDGNSNIYVVKTNNQGDTLWVRVFGKGLLEQGMSVVEDDGYIIVGNAIGDTVRKPEGLYGDAQSFIMKIDEDGKIVWQRIIGSEEVDEDGNWVVDKLNSVIKTSDAFIMTGETNGVLVVIKTDKNGISSCQNKEAGFKSFSHTLKEINLNLTQIDVNPETIIPNIKKESATPVNIICSTLGVDEPVITETISVYPNPATDYITVVVAGKSNFILYDSFGKLVFQKIVMNEEKISLTNFSAGIYFYNIVVKDEIQKGKIIVL